MIKSIPLSVKSIEFVLTIKNDEMTKFKYLSIAACLALSASNTYAQTTVIIESWRADGPIWNEKIIPAFNKHHPEITVKYVAPSEADVAKWNSDPVGFLQRRITSDQAGDLIACRPFDGSLELFQKGLLKEVTEMEGIEHKQI